MWMTPRMMKRAPGNPGICVILIDSSRSISRAMNQQIGAEIDVVKKQVPSLRVFSFMSGVVEVKDTTRISAACPHADGVFGDGRNVLFLAKALDAMSTLRPQKTIVFSDGGVADRGAALRAADRITGNIDAYYCRPNRTAFQTGELGNVMCSAEQDWLTIKRLADPGLMMQLARRGGGRFVDLNWDPRGRGISIELEHSTRIVRQPVVHHHQLPPKHVYR